MVCVCVCVREFWWIDCVVLLLSVSHTSRVGGLVVAGVGFEEEEEEADSHAVI